MAGPVQVGERPSAQDRTCPFCRGPLGPDAVWTCPRCATEHHDACALEHDGCTVLGCGGRHAGAADGHWPAAHAGARAPQDAAGEAPAGRGPLLRRGGAAAAALGAAVLLAGALLELPGPSRDAAIGRAAPVLGLGAGLLLLGLALLALAVLVGQPDENQASRQR